MRAPTALPAVALAALALAGCAETASRAGDGAQARAGRGRECFTPREVTNFAAVDDRTVNVRVGANRVFALDLLGPCPDIDWSQRLAIKAEGSSWICRGIDATIIAPSTLGPQRCAVRTLRQLTPQEIAALPARARP